MGKPSGVFLMCDYSADPIWDQESGVNLDLDDFPLSPQLKDALRAWAAWFDSTEPEPGGQMWRNEYEWRSWREFGAKLVEATAAELAPRGVDVESRWCSCRACSPEAFTLAAQ